MSNRAWVTLATNDSYGLGALVLAHSLRRAGSVNPAVVLITPSVTEAMRDRLRAVFAEVVIVDVLDSKDAAHLALLQRPELGITFTKIHCWNLTQYEKCVFLDADTLIVQNCDELFEREELSAAPDVGWPDCFNSGVFVFKPSAETFASLIKFAQERGSFDGGDQGLLNSYFSDWAHGDINKHLPFLYNVTSAAFYSYLPALKHYGQNLKIIHFIGATKPWLQQFNWETRTSEAPQHLRDFLQLWWDIFVAHVHSVLDTSMVEIEEVLPAASSQGPFIHTEPRLDYCHYEPVLDPESEFPWHHPGAQIPDAETNVPDIDMTQFYDPWDIYKGHIPPNTDNSSTRHLESQKEQHEETRKYAWDYISPQHYQHDVGHSEVQNIWKPDHNHQAQVEHVDLRGSVWEYNTQHNHNSDQQYSQNIYQESPNYTDQSQKDHTHQYNVDSFHAPEYQQESIKDQSQNHYHSEHFQQKNQSHYSNTHNLSHDQNDNYEVSFRKDSEKTYYPIQQQRVEHVYYVHLDHEKIGDRQHHITDNSDIEEQSKMNGHGELDCAIFENIRPRHPYDGFYLRHRMTIDSRGRKICTHEVPPTPTSSPPESPIPEDNSLTPFEEEENEQLIETEDQVSPSLKDLVQVKETGVAGNFARMVLGAGAQREALDDLTRRQGWEAGNIDYMGADAFDNIWAKISQTLSQPRSSPPKQSSPPPVEVPAPVEQVLESPPPQAPVEPSSPVVVSAPEVAPVVAPASDAAPIIAPATEVAPIVVPAPEVAPIIAPAPEVAPIVAPAPEVAPIVAPAPEVAPIVAPAPTPAPAETPKSINDEAPVEPKIPEPKVEAAKLVKSSEPEAKAPIAAAVPAAVIEPAKVVAAVPTEPKPATDAPVVAPAPVAAVPAAPTKPATIPSVTSEVKNDAAPVSKTPPLAEAPVTTTAAPSKPATTKSEVTPIKGASTTDSPPLANTPSKEELPVVPAAKSEERRKPAGRLQLPAAAADALPTPDSEQEDAATLAHAIIAGELCTPTVTSPTPPADPAFPPPLSVPPAVSLSQIGVEPKPKTTTAAQIESSVTVAAADPPKKKVVKKVLKKEGGGGEAPVPPPRKKEKKPKEK